jgi:hypothetical protein
MEPRHRNILGNDLFSYIRADSRELSQNRQRLPVLANSRMRQNLLDIYPEPLVEELVAPHTFIGTHKSNPATSLEAEELGYSRKRLSQASAS